MTIDQPEDVLANAIAHYDRGLFTRREADRPITDNLPLPPTPVVVPDHVPDTWPERMPR